MLKGLLISAILGVLSFSNEPKVFICDSENSVAYHLKKECRGIKPGKEDILEVTVVEAEKKGLRVFGWED